ncbi:hypothetical protein QYE76_031731 [Lolium multiflorum]|uniref:Reverse transcriptase zinc-binding domain-containing protein n=1 Tax=Lolium multiflorum TaxID=4521 RepID=A0AAD8VKP8_LOLMU|nr:hypothetical protein QYE76_031731 [Lolium multiflorum]
MPSLLYRSAPYTVPKRVVRSAGSSTRGVAAAQPAAQRGGCALIPKPEVKEEPEEASQAALRWSTSAERSSPQRRPRGLPAAGGVSVDERQGRARARHGDRHVHPRLRKPLVDLTDGEADQRLVKDEPVDEPDERVKQEVVTDDMYNFHRRDLGDFSTSPSFLERIVMECLPLYRVITGVSVVSSCSTSFWHDRLASLLLRRRSSTLSFGWSSTSLHASQDQRRMASPAAPRFSSHKAYRLLSSVHPHNVSSCRSWALHLPLKLRIFAYLADIDRLSTRSNLFYKSCAPSDVCAACPSVETGRHLFFGCCLAKETWGSLHVTIPAKGFSIWDLSVHLSAPASLWHACIAAILWALWKAQNDLVFNANTATSSIERLAGHRGFVNCWPRGETEMRIWKFWFKSI